MSVSAFRPDDSDVFWRRVMELDAAQAADDGSPTGPGMWWLKLGLLLAVRVKVGLVGEGLVVYIDGRWSSVNAFDGWRGPCLMDERFREPEPDFSGIEPDGFEAPDGPADPGPATFE